MSAENLTVDQLPMAATPLDPGVRVPLWVLGKLSRTTLADLVALVEVQQGTVNPAQWVVATTDQEMIPSVPYLADATLTSRVLALPAVITPGQQFRAYSAGGQTTIVSSGNIITAIGAGNDLVLAAGKAATLVARTSSDLEIVAWQV